MPKKSRKKGILSEWSKYPEDDDREYAKDQLKKMGGKHKQNKEIIASRRQEHQEFEKEEREYKLSRMGGQAGDSVLRKEIEEEIEGINAIKSLGFRKEEKKLEKEERKHQLSKMGGRLSGSDLKKETKSPKSPKRPR